MYQNKFLKNSNDCSEQNTTLITPFPVLYNSLSIQAFITNFSLKFTFSLFFGEYFHVYTDSKKLKSQIIIKYN